jgi:hypothetical protein
VAQFDGAVGFATAEFGARFDDQDPPLAGQSQQLHGQHRR